MKRSDVLSRLGNLSARWGSLLSGNREHMEELFVEIAKSLGVEVEPDELELPERLLIYGPPIDASRRERLPVLPEGWKWYDVPAAPAASWECIILSPSPKLAEALVTAYNDRPRWRTGEPPAPGRYLIKTPMEQHPVVALGGPSLVYGVWNWRWNNATAGDVTAWMPLPKP